jgi:hypothetical protein
MKPFSKLSSLLNFGGKKSDNSTERSESFYRSTLPPLEEFSERMLINTLSKIINDAVIPIELKNEEDSPLVDIGSEFIEISQKEIYQENLVLSKASSLREVAIKSLYREVHIFKVKIGGKSYLFTNLETGIERKGKSIKINNENYSIEKAYLINKPICDKEILLQPFKIIYNYYKQIELYNQKNNQVFFKKNNLNSVLDGIKEPERYEELYEKAQETYLSFMKGGGGIIDALDSFEILSVNIADMTSAMDFAYKEISRILGIPQAELLGESPTGLNSGGVVQFQQSTYEKRLDDYRKRLIEPILKGLDISYTISGLSLEEKLETIYQFSQYLANISVDDKLYVETKEILFKLLNIDYDKEGELNELKESAESLKSSGQSQEFNDNENDDVLATLSSSK